MVKGEDNCPKTITSTLRFLQYYNLRGKPIPSNDKRRKLPESEVAFAQDDDDEGKSESDTPSPPQKKSKICGQWKDGTCHIRKNTRGRDVRGTSGVPTSGKNWMIMVNS